MNLKIKSLNDKFRMPSYATEGSAALDFHALADGEAFPNVVTKVPLGCAVEIPEGWAMLITARSGHGAKYGAGVPHGYGLIDSDYRGELFMVFTTAVAFSWKRGDRIAQGLLTQAHQARVTMVPELSDTSRGAGGFGSTGA